MAKISFMERLTLGIVVGVILFAATFTWMTGITTAVNGIARYYVYNVPTLVNGTVVNVPMQVNPPFPQPFWELTLAFAIGFIPISIVIWDNHQAKLNEPTQTTSDISTQVEAALNAALPSILKKLVVEAQGSKKAPDGPPAPT